MFARLGAAMVRARWMVIAMWLLVAVVGGVIGGRVFDRAVDVPSLGPQAESMMAKARVDQLDPEGPSIEAALLGAGPYDPALAVNAQKIDDQIRQLPGVIKVDDVYNQHGQTGADNNSSLVRVHLADHLSEADLEALEDRVVELLHGLQAPQVYVTGEHLVQRAFADQATADSIRGESIALVFLVLVLVIVFRGFRGAAVPVVVAFVVIAAGLLGLYALSFAADISQYAVNIVTLFGIGLAVDYSVLLLFRFREARAEDPNASAADLVPAVLATAGRAVLISGAAVAAAMVGLSLFGEPLLAAMALGGAVVVVLATAVALTLVPAGLAVLGARLPVLGDETWVTRVGARLRRAWPVRSGGAPATSARRLQQRQAATRQASARRTGAYGLLGRLARVAQRRPGPVAVVSTVGLLALASLFLFANLGNSDARAMPTSMEVRQGYDAVQKEFNNNRAAPVTIVAEIAPNRADLTSYLNRLERLPGKYQVAVRPDIPRTATVINVYPTGDTAGPPSRELVREIRAMPTMFRVTVGGPAAELVDYENSVGSHLPVVMLVLLVAAGVLLFVLTGSVVVPVKAVVLNILTLGATLGVLVVTFQWGWAGWLLGFSHGARSTSLRPAAVHLRVRSDDGLRGVPARPDQGGVGPAAATGGAGLSCAESAVPEAWSARPRSASASSSSALSSVD